MKEENYYRPEIEEFHIGFEYEAFHNKEWFFEEGSDQWVKSKVSLGTDIWTIKYAIDCDFIRVKYLDREDIESLGFFVATTSGMEAAYGKRDDNNELRFILREKYHNNTIEIERILYYNSGKKTIFDGTIKKQIRTKEGS